MNQSHRITTPESPGGNTEKRTRPWHLWLVGIVGGLWSVMGAVSFVLTQLKVEEVMSRFPAEQRAYFESFAPHVWPVAFWSIGVLGGVIGCLLLLLKRRHAFHAWVASLIGWLVCNLGGLLFLDGLKVMREPADLGFTIMPIIIAAFLAGYAGAMSRKGVLR